MSKTNKQIENTHCFGTVFSSDKNTTCPGSIFSADDENTVRHAKWLIKDNHGNGVCSQCHRQDHVDPLARYCRYCGAKMDLE